ncbi:ubiquinol oxidase subunit II [Luteimonas sp. BDR2-5]|uniref:ubiquinol oxidase subunit II n=1 Tax=Proluteimonas luteida TaxID=2878685 RepID=UPI001E32D687|nr:ubiquinol oxidase subunit II [Luteimonas sp. BDR2-5]MCD9029621.1 ubiquinol oxidase subunit II [Luteimonas sp. BDR2-5]
MKSILRAFALLSVALILSGCDWVVMRPSGDIAVQQRDLIVVSTVLMLLIIVPVVFLTFFFAWKYRASNREAEYLPDWHHSTRLELVIWLAPLAIIIVLGTITWITTHKLDPYRPLDRIDATRPVPDDVEPLVVEVVALDWKWMFLYPEQGIATINELAAPVDTPIQFKITSASMMNSFFIPALAGQIYAMAGMETKLHAVINKEGVYKGFSANYSGDGFSHMRFDFHGMSRQDFDAWVATVREGEPLDRAGYLEIEKPSEREPVRHFGSVDADLYDAILNMCVAPDAMCIHEMMHIDMSGGGGVDSRGNLDRLRYDNRHADEPIEAPGATFPDSGREARGDDEPQGHQPRAADPGDAAPQPTPDSDLDSEGATPRTPDQAPTSQGAPAEPDGDSGP